MKLQRVFEYLSDLSSQRVIPQGVIDEGRIFALGIFENADQLHGRVTDVVEGLKEHVGQPFEMHPWAFVIDLSTAQQDGVAKPLTFVEVVLPQQNGAVYVSQYLAMPRRLRLIDHFIYKHTPTERTSLFRNPTHARKSKKTTLRCLSTHSPSRCSIHVDVGSISNGLQALLMRNASGREGVQYPRTMMLTRRNISLR